MVKINMNMLVISISFLYENKKSVAELPIPTKPKMAPKQIGQSLAENKVAVNATKPVPVLLIINLFF